MIQVIHIEYVDGAGTEDDPVTRYHRAYLVKSKRVTAYQQHVGLIAMLEVNRSKWRASHTDSFRLTARFFVGNARVVDIDNMGKACSTV